MWQQTIIVSVLCFNFLPVAQAAGDISQIDLSFGITHSTLQFHPRDTFDVESRYLEFGYWESMGTRFLGGLHLGFSDATLERGDTPWEMQGQRLGLRFKSWAVRAGPFAWTFDAHYRFERMQDNQSTDLVVQAYHWNVLTGADVRFGTAINLFASAGLAGVNGKYRLPTQPSLRYQQDERMSAQGGLSYAFGEGDSVGLTLFGMQTRGAELYFQHQYR